MIPTPRMRANEKPPNWAAVLTLNNLDLTKQVIADLLRQDVGEMWILVIDNASTDGTQEWVQNASRENRIEFIFNEKNVGVGPAWNQAANYIFSTGAGYALLCNNDIRLRPDTYRHLLTPRGGFVTPVNTGSWDRALAGDVLVSFDPYMKGGPDFSCFLLKQWFYEQLGGFPECYYPAYFEDNETHWQAKVKGLGDQIYSTGVPYYHIGSQTIKNNPEIARVNSEHFERNRQLYVSRWGGPPGREIFTKPYGIV